MSAGRHKKKKQQIELDIRSNAVKEILGQAPRWVIRWGITVILTILIFILIGAAIISYDDVVPARITITTIEPPVYIEARASGKIKSIYVKPDQSVKEGELLAVIDNTASELDVLWVKKMIDAFRLDMNDLQEFNKKYQFDLSLGTVQYSYYMFLTRYQEYLLYLKNDPNQRQITRIEDQIASQLLLMEKQRAQLDLFREELKLSKASYERAASLADNAVISKSEFERSSRAYLGDKQQYERLEMQLATTAIEISRLRTNKESLLLSHEEELFQVNQYFEESLQNLKNSIETWEENYAIISPIDGKITLFDIWNKNQNVNIGDVLVTVVPNQKGALIGRVVLPILNSGKVKEGQKVIIKLDNYSHQEWGSLSGVITNISAVPKRGQAEYAIQVELEGLLTSFDKELEFKQEMQGTAEIVTEELTLLQRIFYQLREVVSQ